MEVHKLDEGVLTFGFWVSPGGLDTLLRRIWPSSATAGQAGEQQG